MNENNQEPDQKPKDQQPADPEPTTEMRLRLPAVLVLYGLMAVAGVVWLRIRDRTAVFSEQALGEIGPVWSLGLGAAVGFAGVGLLALGQRYLVPIRGLEGRLARLFGELRDFELVGISLAIAVGEELFFRAAMQDAWGLWLTALLYGLLNTGPGLLLWGALCVVSGIVFGYIVQLGGGLLAATVAHALLNYFFLGRLPKS